MKYKIKFKEHFYGELKNYLFNLSPKENGCFLLGNVIENVIFITDCIYPDSEEDLQREKNLCVPNSSYIMSAILEAKEKKKSLLFVHSHPQEDHPTHFSEIDIISNDKLFGNLSEILSLPLGSIVMSQKGLHGIIFHEKKYYKISSYTSIGDFVNIMPDTQRDIKGVDNEMFDRQIQFLKKQGSETIKNLNVAIVGLGGIGSPLAVMLSKMGVGQIAFYDDDKLERHNLPRIFGAVESDIGKYKVDIVKEHIFTFADTEIVVYKEKVTEDTDGFSEYDVIFGCLDNQTARAALNNIAVKLAIPYIDSGCAIPLDNKLNIIQAVTSVSIVLPGQACLWCAQILNGLTIREESFTDEETKNLKEDGYIQGVTKAPSIISLTTSVASAAAHRLFNVLGIYSSSIPMRTVYDFNRCMEFAYEHTKEANCSCVKNDPFN